MSSLLDFLPYSGNSLLAQEIPQSNDQPVSLAADLAAQGLDQYQQGQFELALETLQKALDLYRQASDIQGEGNVLNDMGISYRALGRYAEAIHYYEQALNIEQHLGNRSYERRILGNLANTYALIGRYSLAEDYQKQSLQIAQELGDIVRIAISLTNLGSIYLDQSQFSEATQNYEMALNIFQEAGDSRYTPNVLTNIASIYHIQHRDFEQAIFYYQKGLDLARINHNRWLEAECLSGLGFVNESLGNYETALDYYDRGLAIFDEIQAHKSIAMALNNRAHTLLAWGQSNTSQQQISQAKYQEAEANLRQAISILDSARANLTNDTDRVSLFDTQAMTYNLLQQVLVVQDKFDLALQVSEQGRSRAFTALLAEKQQLISENISLEQLKEIAKTQNATLVEYSLIPEDEFIHQGNRRGTTAELYIWVVQPDGTVHFRRSPINTQTHRLEDLVKTSRDAIGVRSRGFEVVESEPTEPNENLKTLHQLLIAPIQDLLPTDPEKQVIFIPQGDLFLVPFAALVDSAGDYLIQHHTLLTAPSIEVLALTQQQRARLDLDQPITPADLLIVGNPVMPEVWDARSGQMKTLSPLAGASQEAHAIATLFNTSALTGAEATEHTIKQRIGNARLVHLATHGLLEYGNPQDSGVSDVPGAIALTPGQGEDGLLTAAEILETLDLKAELVVLSACDTGLGNITGDGVIGLSRALITAGTPSVIVSLWAVPDAPTAELMTDFYQQIQQGQDKAQALRQAMLETMKTNPDPRDWAAFTLIGTAN